MNILLVVPWDNLGGVCAVVNQVAKHLRADGHRVYYLLPGPTIRPTEGVTRHGFPAYYINLRSPTSYSRSPRSLIAWGVSLPRTLLELSKLIRQLQIDVINVHFPGGTGVDFAILRWLGMAKLVASLHGADLLPNGTRVPRRQLGVRALLAASDMIVTPSDAYRAAVRDAWPQLRRRPIETIPNGVDPEELGYSVNRGGASSEPPYVLSILQLVHYKGVDVLIRAFAEICPSFPELRLKLISDGPNRSDFIALTATLGISDRVDFLGVLEKPAVAAHLRECTLFVLPSRSNSESFGIAAAEAMAVDRAVVASRVGGLSELIEDEVSGLLVPPGDARALATALRRLVPDAALRERLGTNGGRRVRRDLLWGRTGTAYEEMFLRVLGRPFDDRLEGHASGSRPPVTVLAGSESSPHADSQS